MELNKITVQLIKLCDCYKHLTLDQKIDLVKTIDTINNGSFNSVYVPADDLEQIESVILSTCETVLNADILNFFLELGYRAHQQGYYDHYSNKLLKIHKNELLKGDFTSWKNYSIIDYGRAPMDAIYCAVYSYNFVQNIQIYDHMFGLEKAGIPRWILDIPVTKAELQNYDNTCKLYEMKKEKGKVYILRKFEQEHKTYYSFCAYKNSLHGDYIKLASKREGLVSLDIYNKLGGAIKRVKNLSEQLDLIAAAYEKEKREQEQAAERSRIRQENNPKSRFYKGKKSA